MSDIARICQEPFEERLGIFGFSSNRSGAHMARSMMLTELKRICETLPPDAGRSDYRAAIEQDNILGKSTFSSRKKSFAHLSELYTLEPRRTLFRLLRQFAKEDPAGLPLIGMVCAFCRDPQLRRSFALVERLKPGEILSRERMELHLEKCFPHRYTSVMKSSLAQHVNTTWTVSGHLRGGTVKRRSFPEPRFTATTYAMLAGWLSGLRGQILLQSVFARLLALDAATVVGHLAEASSRGWVRLRHAGEITEIDFTPLLTAEEEKALHVPD